MKKNNKKLDLNLIRAKRLEKNISLVEMAERVGMTSNSQYYKYEAGIYKFNANTVPKVAEALGMKIEDLYN